METMINEFAMNSRSITDSLLLEMKKMAFDVYESKASDGTKVEVFIEKKVDVETGATAIVDWTIEMS